MKKLLYLSALVLGFGFAACDDYMEPNPPAQSNPQESILKTDEVNVTPIVEGVYNLYELNEAGTPIDIADINCTTLPAGYEFLTNLEISNNEFTTAYTVPSEVILGADGEYIVRVNPDDLQGVYEQNISKDPAQATIQYRLSIMTQTGSQLAYVGGADYYYGPFDITIVPFPADKVIETAYYLVSSANNWDLSSAIKLTNSGASPYDDPNFTATFEITNDMVAAGYEWKIIPESTKVAGTMDGNTNYGAVENPDYPMTGALVLNGDNGVVNTAGVYLLTVDMYGLTYAFTSAVDFLYTPGASNGWSQTDSQVLYTDNYADYYGYAYLDGEFKFTSAPDWNHTNYGNSGVEGEISTDPGAGNLTVAEAGLYWCHVNTATLTYTTTLITTIGVIGDSTPGGWDASTALTPSADFLTWEGDIDFAGGEFKFRANDGWDINLGGSLENLTQDGSNIASPGEGTYHVVLNLGSYPYSAQITKK